MQYTIRNVSRALDAALRARARASGKSLNETVLETLELASGLAETKTRYRKLSDLAGTWVEDASTAAVLEEQRAVDPSEWR